MAVLRSIQQLESLAGEWNGLADLTRHALLRHEWFLSAARTLHANDTLAVVADRDAAGRLTAVAPLVARVDGGVTRVELLGSSALHEPAGFLCPAPERRAALLESILELRQPMLLRRMVADSLPSLSEGQTTNRHGLFISRPGAACLAIDLAGEAATFFDTLPGKLRYDIRRARTRAEALGAVTFEALAPAPSDVDRLFSEFMTVEAAGWKGRRGSALAANPSLRAFFRFYCERTAEQGTLRMFRLRIAGKVAAVQMSVELYNRLWVLKIGYDEAMGHCSPGPAVDCTGDPLRARSTGWSVTSSSAALKPGKSAGSRAGATTGSSCSIPGPLRGAWAYPSTWSAPAGAACDGR